MISLAGATLATVLGASVLSPNIEVTSLSATNGNEYIELYNGSSEDVDFSRMQISYHNGGGSEFGVVLPKEGTFAKGDYLVIGETAISDKDIDLKYVPTNSSGLVDDKAGLKIMVDDMVLQTLCWGGG